MLSLQTACKNNHVLFTRNCYRRRNWLGIEFRCLWWRSASSWRRIPFLSDDDVEKVDSEVADVEESPDLDGWYENLWVVNHVLNSVTWCLELATVSCPPGRRFHPRRSQQPHRCWLEILDLPSKRNQLAALITVNSGNIFSVLESIILTIQVIFSSMYLSNSYS